MCSKVGLQTHLLDQLSGTREHRGRNSNAKFPRGLQLAHVRFKREDRFGRTRLGPMVQNSRCRDGPASGRVREDWPLTRAPYTSWTPPAWPFS
jgi:hypothetical protein